MNLTWRPIEKWDGPETPPLTRRCSPFKSTYKATLDLLERELRLIEGDLVVIQVDVTERACRVDGSLRADARLATPRVRLAFESMHGPLTYQCDAFTDWQENIRAIALGLESLRRLERYGIAGRGEQYTGWKQLGSGIVTGVKMSRREAVAVILDITVDEGRPMYAADDLDLHGRPGPFLDDAYRVAAKIAHPDHGGTESMFAALVDAYGVLAE